jgi:DNA-directed RNA polymerase sigma subunit (sigma70/sigma32)
MRRAAIALAAGATLLLGACGDPAAEESSAESSSASQPPEAVPAVPGIEAEIVRLRFGMTGEATEPCTLDEAVRRLGIPRSRVRKMEAQALARLARMREVAELR